MFGLGMSELLVILAVALLVLGPKRLPELASSLGKMIREFRRATRDLGEQIEIDESVRKPFLELKTALRDEPPPYEPPPYEPPPPVAGPPLEEPAASTPAPASLPVPGLDKA